jgi:excisionase family DNA binding protein
MSATAVQPGLTPSEVAKVLRVSPNKVRTWIDRGELEAVNTADARCGKRRFVVLPEQLAAFTRGRQAATPPKPRRRKRPVKDYLPDL